MGSNRVTKGMVKQYWSEVRSRAWKRAWIEGEMKTVFIGFALLALSVGLAGVLVLFGVIPPISSLAGLVSQATQGGVALLIAFGTTIVLFYVGMNRVPAEMHEELGGFQENPFEIEIFPPKNISETKNRWVSLKVHNATSAKDLIRCSLLLDNIYNFQNGKIAKREQKLTWSGREQNQTQAGNQSLPIAATDHAVCDVAVASPSEGIAKYCQWFGNDKVREGKYILNLVVFGSWKDKSYHPKYRVALEFRGGNNISLSDVREGWHEQEK